MVYATSMAVGKYRVLFRSRGLPILVEYLLRPDKNGQSADASAPTSRSAP